MNDELGSGRFFSFPIDDGVLEDSADGLNFLHDFVNERAHQHADHQEGFGELWPSMVLDKCLPTISGPGKGHKDRAKESMPLYLPEKIRLERPSANLSSSRDLTDDATTQNGAHQDSCIRQRNRAAQKRFRERQKAKQASHSKEVEELQQRMQNLAQENETLKSQCKLLQHRVLVNSTQNSELQSQQEDSVAALQQEVILQMSVEIYRRGIDKPDLSLEDTKKLTMEGFIQIFEMLMRKYSLLLDLGAWDPGTPAHEELKYLIDSRRIEEARLALFSHWTPAVLAWNREETSRHQPPSASFYTTVLTRLNLTSGQQQSWLKARRKLLAQMAELRMRRDKAALAVGMLVLRNAQTAADGTSKEEARLREALEEEREAVVGFLFSCIDCCLAPPQEALLDVLCYPWWPCIWTIANVLAHKHKKEPPDTLADSSEDALFLQLSATQFLREPVLARMGGLLSKCTQLAVPVPRNVVQALNVQPPRIADLRHLTCFEVMCGAHLQGTSKKQQELVVS